MGGSREDRPRGGERAERRTSREHGKRYAEARNARASCHHGSVASAGLRAVGGGRFAPGVHARIPASNRRCRRSVEHLPHFHAYYQDTAAVFSIDPVEWVGGILPRRQARLVEARAELHQEELRADWARLLRGEQPAPIDPLT